MIVGHISSHASWAYTPTSTFVNFSLEVFVGVSVGDTLTHLKRFGAYTSTPTFDKSVEVLVSVSVGNNLTSPLHHDRKKNTDLRYGV